MARTLRVQAPDVRELAADLESVQVGMGKMVGVVRREAAELVAGRARRLTPVGPGPNPRARGDASLPHIRDTIVGRAGGVITTHPGGIVHEFGGTIAPRGVPIHIRRSAMAYKASVRETSRVERLLARRFDDLLKQAGL